MCGYDEISLARASILMTADCQMKKNNVKVFEGSVLVTSFCSFFLVFELKNIFQMFLNFYSVQLE